MTRLSGRITAFGNSTITRMKAEPKFCLKCLTAMAIQCRCGQSIFIGDPVVAYYDPEHIAVLIGDKPGPAYLGCMYCTDSTANIGGIWMPGDDGKGRVAALPLV